MLDPESNDFSYLRAEHRPDLEKIIPDPEVAEKLLHNTQDHASLCILDGFDYLFSDEYESMQKRLRIIYDNGHTVASFSDELNKLYDENKYLLSGLEWV